MEVLHRIRLAGPWELQVQRAEVEEADGEGGRLESVERHAVRVRLPCDWQRLAGRLAADSILRRTFHAPTGLDDRERVYLCVAPFPLTMEVLVNQQTVGLVAPSSDLGRFWIDPLLQANRVLLRVVEGDEPGQACCPVPNEPVGTVWLEIAAPAA